MELNILEWKAYERNYWRYYLQLENDFLHLIEYVEFDAANFSVYSVKIMQLLLSIGSEVDAVLKEICKIKDKNRPNMGDYAPIILTLYPNITKQSVYVFKRTLKLFPFDSWDLYNPSKSLQFWNVYNEVKHHRTEQFSKATLGAVANGLAALFVLNIYKLHDLFEESNDVFQSMPEDESKLFYLENWTEGIRTSQVKHPYRLIDYDDNSVIFQP